MISQPEDDLDLDQDLAQDESGEEERPFVYRDAEQWLVELALPHYLRDKRQGHRWAPNWYDYPEADTLVQALWETWEQMRWDGAQAILVYFRDYFYPLMDRLTAEDGPFHNYDPPVQEKVPAPWETEPAPPGYFERA